VTGFAFAQNPGMATVHLIHGFLCCGKTTFAKELESRTGGIRISLDEWMTELTGDPVHLDQPFVERIYAQMMRLWPQLAARGLDVILDFGFWRRRYRDEARAKAVAIGASVRLYRIWCSDDVARARCRERNKRLGASYHVSDEGFEEMRSRFEPLDPDEQHDVVET
jgi:predicted kinase